MTNEILCLEENYKTREQNKRNTKSVLEKYQNHKRLEDLNKVIKQKTLRGVKKLVQKKTWELQDILSPKYKEKTTEEK